MGSNVNIDKSRAKKVIEPSFEKKYSGIILPVFLWPLFSFIVFIMV